MATELAIFKFDINETITATVLGFRRYRNWQMGDTVDRRGSHNGVDGRLDGTEGDLGHMLGDTS